MSFTSYPINPFLKEFPVNDITDSYDGVITKVGRANFLVIYLLNSKTNVMLIKSYLSKICTSNFDRMLFRRLGIHYKRKN